MLTTESGRSDLGLNPYSVLQQLSSEHGVAKDWKRNAWTFMNYFTHPPPGHEDLRWFYFAI